MSSSHTNTIRRFFWKAMYVFFLIFDSCAWQWMINLCILSWTRCCGEGTNQRETRWFKETVDELFHWYGVFIIADYIPYLKWVTKLQGIDASLQALHTKLSTFLEQIVDEHRRNPNVVDNYTVKDFVDVLLTMPQEDGTGHLSDDTIQAIITVSGSIIRLVW